MFSASRGEDISRKRFIPSKQASDGSDVTTTGHAMLSRLSHKHAGNQRRDRSENNRGRQATSPHIHSPMCRHTTHKHPRLTIARAPPRPTSTELPLRVVVAVVPVCCSVIFAQPLAQCCDDKASPTKSKQVARFDGIDDVAHPRDASARCRPLTHDSALRLDLAKWSRQLATLPWRTTSNKPILQAERWSRLLFGCVTMMAQRSMPRAACA
jgi:hypothetical protein